MNFWFVSGYPPLLGDTLLDKRRYAREHVDHLRRALMFEPRGHKEMYGTILVDKDIDEADIAVLFMHNEGTIDSIIMCLCITFLTGHNLS